MTAVPSHVVQRHLSLCQTPFLRLKLWSNTCDLDPLQLKGVVGRIMRLSLPLSVSKKHLFRPAREREGCGRCLDEETEIMKFLLKKHLTQHAMTYYIP